MKLLDLYHGGEASRETAKLSIRKLNTMVRYVGWNPTRRTF